VVVKGGGNGRCYVAAVNGDFQAIKAWIQGGK
jgi:hypothetical protein